MPQFVIERDIPGAGSLTEEQLRQVSLQSLETLKNMGPHIQWLHSYVTEDKVYCVYLAPDEETIRDHAQERNSRGPSLRGTQAYRSCNFQVVGGDCSSASRIAA
jgi:hypothetical protein